MATLYIPTSLPSLLSSPSLISQLIFFPLHYCMQLNSQLVQQLLNTTSFESFEISEKVHTDWARFYSRMGTTCEFDKSTIASELIQGMEVARQLKFHLNSSSSSPENQLSLLQKILSSYDTALLLLNWSESSAVHPQTVPAMFTLPESPISTNESGDFKDHHRDVSKKRWLLPL